MVKNVTVVDEGTLLATPIIDTSLCLEVVEITNAAVVKDKLIKLYGEKVEAETSAGVRKIGELEDCEWVRIKAQPDFNKDRYNAADAARVTARLTLPEIGCPWDRAQTHESIRINLIEEAYEAVDAIDKHDVPNMREEFGDVFLQSLLQSDIARRAGEFDFDDVCDELAKKLISRHTFIFGGDSASNPDEALSLWERAKATEKHYDTVKTQLKKLPDNFPALLYSQKTIKKLKKAGVEFDAQAALDKALADKDYAAAIYALTALIAVDGKDAEVELNKLVKAKIEKL